MRIALLVTAWLLACLPLFIIDILPLVDYPGHLVRVHLLANWSQLQGHHAYYQPAWGVLPNLALELVAVPLAKVFSAEVAMKVFVAIAFALIVFGGARLNRAVTGEWSAWAIAPALLLYNKVFAYGFLNFLFGLGLMLLALALHIEGNEKATWRRVAREALLVTSLFFSHMVALALYVLASIAFDVGRAARERDRSFAFRGLKPLAIALVIPLALLMLSPTGAETGGAQFSSLGAKASRFLTILLTGQGDADWIFAGLLAGSLALLWITRQIKLERSMAWPLAVLLLAFLAAPFAFATAQNVDTRLPLVFLVVLAASFRVSPGRNLVVGTVLGALLLGRVAMTITSYSAWSEQLVAARRDLRFVPEHSLLFMAREADSGAYEPDRWNPSMVHANTLVLLEKPLFVMDLFTNPNQQPLVRTPPFRNLTLRASVGEGDLPDLDAYGGRLRALLKAEGRSEEAYVYLVRGTGPLPTSEELELLISRDRYALYRLKR